VKSVRALAAALVAGLLVAACSGGSSSTPAEPASATSPPPASVPARLAAADAPGDWTVFLYMAADNDLEAAAVDDVMELADASGTEFVVLLDRHPGYDTTDLAGLGDFADSVVLDVVDGEATLVATPGELNMGDPETLAGFIAETVPEYGSDHNAFVIWDHGGAWQGAAHDDTDEDKLTVDEIESGLRSGLARTDVEAFDLLGFDACLMATYEVVAPLAELGAYLVASEELEPGHGWDWSALSTPASGSTTTEFASAVIDGFNEQAADAGETAVTLSLIDLTKIEALDDAAAELAAAMTDEGREVVGRIGATRSQTVSFGRHPDPKADFHSVDLGQFVELLADVDPMADAARRFGDALDDVVVESENGPVLADATGLAAYFPPSSAVVSPKYDTTLAPGWAEVLDAFYGAADRVPESALPAFVDDDFYVDEEDAVTDVDGVALRGRVDSGTGGNIAFANYYWGEVASDTDWVVWFGQANAQVDGDEVEVAYDWRYLTVSDGVSTVNAYSTLTYGRDGELAKIVVPITYQRGAQSVDGVLQLLLDGARVRSEAFFLNTGGIVAPFKPRPGDTFVPLLKRQNLATQDAEWVPAGSTPLAAQTDGLSYRYDVLPGAVPIMLGVELSDVAGNPSYLFYGTATPAELG
jgi:hypothetical protein